MKLVYDNIVFGIQRFGGISVVWQELLSRIANHIQDIEYIDIDQSQNYSRSKLDIPAGSIIQHIRHPKVSRYMPVRMHGDEPFLFHSSYYRYCTNRNAINITTVHDFTYELYNSGLRQKVHTWQKNAAIRHSDAVVCISENTKRDLLRLLPDVDEAKVHVIYNGVSDTFCQLHEPAEAAQLPFPENSYVVFIGRRDSYKNFDYVVRSVAATPLNLLIIGSQLNEAERKDIELHLSPKRYQCLSHIPDERLNQLYNHAAALVYPSSYEGFGLPVLEAQRANCPVIALKASSIPEVIGATPLLMTELSDAELISKLQLLDNQDLMQQVKKEGLTNARRFSWQEMASQYEELYQGLYTNGL